MLSHIGFHVFIYGLVQGVKKVIGGLVLGEGMRLPVIELDLFSHIEKKIDIVGAHEVYYTNDRKL
jgi:hypothetical protein